MALFAWRRANLIAEKKAFVFVWIGFIGSVVHLTGGSAMAFEIKSPAFSQGQIIPDKYTCDGLDVSIPLAWSDPPAGVQSFALIGEDPDAPGGTFDHWVLCDLPAAARQLPEGVPKKESLHDGAKQRINDFGTIGYGGSCPPPGPAHRYFFKLYALDKKTDLPPRASKAQFLNAMKGHSLGVAQLMGQYKR